jgi:hypothetical protein
MAFTSQKSDLVTVTPKKDWHIFQPSHEKEKSVDLSLKEGIEIEIPKRFLETLKSEGVI